MKPADEGQIGASVHLTKTGDLLVFRSVFSRGRYRDDAATIKGVKAWDDEGLVKAIREALELEQSHSN